MKDEILEQIEKLKMMVPISGLKPSKSDVEKYEEWVDEMLGKKCKCKPYEFYPYGCGCLDPRKYNEYKTLLSLVNDLYHKKHSDDLKYYEHRDEIRRIISEVISMSMFIKENAQSMDSDDLLGIAR